MFLHPLLCHCLRYQSISFVFLFVSRYIYADPLHCNMTYLFIRLLKDDLKEYTYAARLSGLVYGIASGMNAILVSKKKTQEEIKQLGNCWAWRKHLTSAFLNEMVNVFSLAYMSWTKDKAKQCILIRTKWPLWDCSVLWTRVQCSCCILVHIFTCLHGNLESIITSFCMKRLNFLLNEL